MKTKDSVLVSGGFIAEARARPMCDAGTVLVEAAFDPDRYHCALFDALGIQKPHGLDQMVPKRQADFLAGRIAADLALRVMDRPLAPVGMAADRAPIWPQGLRGSISHTQSRAACLITGAGRFCGVDLEMIASGSALDAILVKCLSDKENRMVGYGAQLPSDVAATLLFSAKETIFKALYPTVGRFFGFEAAEAQPEWDEGQIPFHLTETLHSDLPRGFPMSVAYEIKGDHVLTTLLHVSD